MFSCKGSPNILLDHGFTSIIIAAYLILTGIYPIMSLPYSVGDAPPVHNDTIVTSTTTDSPDINSASLRYPPSFVYSLDGTSPTKVKRSFRFGVISDLDQHSADSSEPGMWLSYLREGILHLDQDTVNPFRSNVTIEWNDSATHVVKSGLAYSGRGMELSTLNMYNGRLLSCDDRTGVIYELKRDKGNHEIIPTPWAILANGNYSGTGFKCEWAAEKDGDLYVGGNGRDLLFDGKRVHTQKYVKKVTPHGEVSHIDWSDKYDKMADAIKIQYPGFIVHEAAGWSKVLKKWVFMPRYVSREEYDNEHVRYSGSNVAFVADENFDNVQVQHIGRVKKTKSFSGFKWIPDTDDQLIVALKTLELEDEQESFIMAFDVKGNIIMREKKIADQKFEGIEFF